MFELVGSGQIMFALSRSTPLGTLNVTGVAAGAPCAGIGVPAAGADTDSVTVGSSWRAAPSLRNFAVTLVAADDAL